MILLFKSLKNNRQPQAMDRETAQYFQSLPPFIQETIAQSGVQCTCKEELCQCVQHLMGNR